MPWERPPGALRPAKEPSMVACLLSLCLTGAAGLEPPPLVLPAPTPTLVPCPTPIAVCDFARSFRPAPGTYEVLFVHPTKGCPVRVYFTLPPGCPRVCCHNRDLTFDYG